MQLRINPIIEIKLTYRSHSLSPPWFGAYIHMQPFAHSHICIWMWTLFVGIEMVLMLWYFVFKILVCFSSCSQVTIWFCTHILLMIYMALFSIEWLLSQYIYGVLTFHNAINIRWGTISTFAKLDLWIALNYVFIIVINISTTKLCIA